MKTHRYVLISILVVMLYTGTLEAARPFPTSDADVVGTMVYELEVGSYFWSEDIFILTEFKHGITERMEIGVAFEYTIEPDVQGPFSAAEVGMKYTLVPSLFAVSMCGEFGSTAYKLKGIFTRVINPVKCNLNFGYKASGVSDMPGIFFYSVGLIMKFQKFQIGGDISGDEDGLVGWLAGGNYKIIGEFAVDAGFSGTFNGNADYTAIVGLSYVF